MLRFDYQMRNFYIHTPFKIIFLYIKLYEESFTSVCFCASSNKLIIKVLIIKTDSLIDLNKMEILNVIRFIVLTISFAMFCFQLKTATLNLMDPPTVLSQYERDATGNDMPLITVCPTNQINITRMREQGYYDYDVFLM